MMLNSADKSRRSKGVEQRAAPSRSAAAQVVAPQPDAAAAAIVAGSRQRCPEDQETPLAPNGSASTPPIDRDDAKEPAPGITPKHPPVAAADDKADKATLLKKIKEAEATATGRCACERIRSSARSRACSSEALYGEAMAAFQQGDSPAAETISKKASATPGPYKLKSLLLYADTIFRQGDAKRAKDNYISLRALTGDRDFKATVTKKIALCNKQLGLPERDGVVN